MNTVVVVGNNHHNTLGLVRSLGRGGYYVFCIIVEPIRKHSFVVKSRYVKGYQMVKTLQEMIEILKKKVIVNQKPPILTTSDKIAEYIDLHYNDLKDKFVLCNCGQCQGGISKLMDKKEMYNAAEKSGLRVPPSIYLDAKDYDTDKCLGIEIPSIIKPRKSSELGKNSFLVASNIEQIDSYIKGGGDSGHNLITQKYIQPDYEVLIMGVRSRKQGVTILPGELHKIRTCKKAKSLGMLVYAYTSGEFDHAIDVPSIKRFLSNIDYEGIFSIEFIIANGIAYFLEINFRNDGTQFCFEGSGVNLPKLWVRFVMGDDLSNYNHRLQKKYCMVEVNYIKNLDWHHPLSVIKEIRSTNLFALIDKKDLKPAFYKFLWA